MYVVWFDGIEILNMSNLRFKSRPFPYISNMNLIFLIKIACASILQLTSQWVQIVDYF